MPPPKEIECSVDEDFDERKDGPFWQSDDGDDSYDEYEEGVRFVEETEGYCFPEPVFIPAGRQLLQEFEANIDARLAKEFGFE